MTSSHALNMGEAADKKIVANSSMASPDDLQKGMSQLRLEDDGLEARGHGNQYPDRPGQPDCTYYLRTGMCAYGSNCRYNHPTHIGRGTQYTGELPQREGQPDCQFYLKTGTCKFGATCKYHHPPEKLNARAVYYNMLGLPMREGEKSCPFYMKTGACKFGSACKFNHPQPATTGTMYPVTTPQLYGSCSSITPPSGMPMMGGGVTAWPVSRTAYLPSPRMQSFPAYMPFVLPSGQPTIPVQQSWSTYMHGGVSHIPSVDMIASNPLSATTSNSQSGPSIPVNLPERPDQPECQYYMKTGSCKYGPSCKYHHPKERNQAATANVGPLGLPLRPGQQVCPQYSVYGVCKFGMGCKFDHPPVVGYYNYAFPAYPLQDSSAAFPEQRPSQVTLTLLESLPSETMRQHEQQLNFETNNNLQDNEHVGPSQSSLSQSQSRSD